MRRQRLSLFRRADWLQPLGLDPAGAGKIVSLFCYEPPALPQLLLHLAQQATELLVTAGRATAAMHAALGQLAATHAGWNARGLLRLHWLPLLSQRDYDHLLWACDLNFVRGEDSLVRGLLAGVPCIWQAYPQQDAAHHAKLDAFLAWLQPPPDLARTYRVWNGLAAGPLPAPDPAAWAAAAASARSRIEALPELATELGRFAAARVRI